MNMIVIINIVIIFIFIIIIIIIIVVVVVVIIKIIIIIITRSLSYVVLLFQSSPDVTLRRFCFQSRRRLSQSRALT